MLKKNKIFTLVLTSEFINEIVLTLFSKYFNGSFEDSTTLKLDAKCIIVLIFFIIFSMIWYFLYLIYKILIFLILILNFLLKGYL